MVSVSTVSTDASVYDQRGMYKGDSGKGVDADLLGPLEGVVVEVVVVMMADEEAIGDDDDDDNDEPLLGTTRVSLLAPPLVGCGPINSVKAIGVAVVANVEEDDDDDEGGGRLLVPLLLLRRRRVDASSSHKS